MRSTNAPASRARRKARLRLAKGFYGARSKLFRTATEAVDRAMRLATEHRKLKKRDDVHKMAAANKAFAHYAW